MSLRLYLPNAASRRQISSSAASRASYLRRCMFAVMLVAVATCVSNAEAVQITEFPLEPGSKPNYITTGPDGALWFTDAGTNKIGRITTSGQVTEYGLGLTSDAGLVGIAAGP